MADLRTDYTDDQLDPSANVNRTFSIIDNTTGNVIYPNVSLEETTVFTRQGDSHTASITNQQNAKINELSNDLTDNGDSFKFLSQGGKYGFQDPNGNFKAFSGGAIYLGQYSTNKTFDVSELGATSKDQFLVVTVGSWGGSIGANNWSAFVPPSVTLNGNTLSISTPYFWQGTWNTQYATYPLAYKVYFVNDIEDASN